jgi:hypothetical protein
LPGLGFADSSLQLARPCSVPSSGARLAWTWPVASGRGAVRHGFGRFSHPPH